MTKVLFMPFLQIPSGHHQVADTLCDIIHEIDPSIDCDKVDILNYSYGKIESIISRSYLKWIHYSPNTYNWLYQNSVVQQNNDNQKDYKLYELLFKRFVLKLINEKKPDLIVCSHALPSYMLSKLKEKKMITTPVINVYTDFFIHDFWGIKDINYHFVSHQAMKEYLVERGVNESKIFLTGIPIHPILSKTQQTRKSQDLLTCTIMGGSLGVGVINQLIPKLMSAKEVTFYIMCGKNKKLYDELVVINHPKIIPLPYLSKKEEMNEIYSKSDLVVTKPGGVTISECLNKKIPVLIYHALPGQEQINLSLLRNMGLVFDFNSWHEIDCFETELKRFSKKNNIFPRYLKAINQYKAQLSDKPISQILHQIILAI